MPEFTFKGADGKPITITGPEGATREQAEQILRQQRPDWDKKPAYPAGGLGSKGGIKGGTGSDIITGFTQGLLNPFEGGAQFVEHATGLTMAPKGVKDWARAHRKEAQSTALGQGGEIAGDIASGIGLSLATGGAMGAALGGTRLATFIASYPKLASALDWLISHPDAVGTLEGALGGTVAGAAQPVTGGGDYWKTKRNQAATGGTFGAVAPWAAKGIESAAGGIAAGSKWFPTFGLPQSLQYLAGQAGRASTGTTGAVGGSVGGDIIGQRPEETNDGR